MGISAGVSPAKLAALLAAVSPELKALKDAVVPEAEVQAARDYIRGSIYLGAEDVDHMMMRLARNEIHFGHYIPLEEIVDGLMRVSCGRNSGTGPGAVPPGKMGGYPDGAGGAGFQRRARLVVREFLP